MPKKKLTPPRPRSAKLPKPRPLRIKSADPVEERTSLFKRIDPLLKSARAAMQAHDIASVEIRYDGSGDEGQFYAAEYTMQDGTKRASGDSGWHGMHEDLPVLLVTCTNVIDTLCTFDDDAKTWVETFEPGADKPLYEIAAFIISQIVEEQHSGWENDEGGQGVGTITAERVELRHEDNYVEVARTTTSYVYS